MTENNENILETYVVPSPKLDSKKDTYNSGYRIGQVRYFVWMSIAVMLCFILLLAIFIGPIYVGMLFKTFIPWNALEHSDLIMNAFGLGVLPLMAVFVSMRRFQDFNYSKWWAVIMFIPPLNMLVAIILLLIFGDKDSNKYGPPCTTIINIAEILLLVGGGSLCWIIIK